MKEIEQIAVEAEKARAAGKPAALATVVGVEGSGYRLPGARMLIVDGQWIAGSISGGCLEDDVVLRAAEAIRTGEAIVRAYDTSDDDDIVFGLGLGCKGIITVLIEPIRAAGEALDFVGFARACLEERAPGIVATVVRAEGRGGARVGSRVVSRAGTTASDIDDDELKARVMAALEREPASGATSSITIALEQGAAGIFIERIEPAIPLVVFGAGHDAMPMVRSAKQIGWHVAVVDHRPAYATAARFPLADRIVVASPELVPARVALTAETLAVVMTHNYLRDLKLLQLLLPSPVRYIGLLGPRRRAEQLLAELKQGGFVAEPGQLKRLYAPTGLDLGSEGPAEVALSVLAEMQSVVASRTGGHLRDLRSPIHGRASGERAGVT